MTHLPFAIVDCWLVKNTSCGGCDGSGATSVGEHCSHITSVTQPHCTVAQSNALIQCLRCMVSRSQVD